MQCARHTDERTHLCGRERALHTLIVPSWIMHQSAYLHQTWGAQLRPLQSPCPSASPKTRGFPPLYPAGFHPRINDNFITRPGKRKKQPGKVASRIWERDFSTPPRRGSNYDFQKCDAQLEVNIVWWICIYVEFVCTALWVTKEANFIYKFHAVAASYIYI